MVVMKDLRIWEYINPKKEKGVNDYLSVLSVHHHYNKHGPEKP